MAVWKSVGTATPRHQQKSVSIDWFQFDFPCKMYDAFFRDLLLSDIITIQTLAKFCVSDKHVSFSLSVCVHTNFIPAKYHLMWS